MTGGRSYSKRPAAWTWIISLALGPVLDARPPQIPDAATQRKAELQAALNWVYVLQELGPQTFESLRTLPADLVVVDAVSTLWPEDRQGVDAAAEVAALHATRGATLAHKLVLAYVDVGQAEEHRSYWQAGWRPGRPDWIAGLDPDGWEGNYPVAFWRPEWRQIVRATVEQVAREGFDGIYMDWVEAYDDENVLALAGHDGVYAPEAMVDLIVDIRAWGRALNPGFLVVAQNAAELQDLVPRYLEVIDALAQEQLHYDGSSQPDGRPGDCPLPATAALVGTPQYRASLPPGCEDLSTIAVSTEWYLSHLRPIRDRGLRVFVADYAVEHANVRDAFARSLAEGFVPYAARRQLDAIGIVFDPFAGEPRP